MTMLHFDVCFVYLSVYTRTHIPTHTYTHTPTQVLVTGAVVPDDEAMKDEIAFFKLHDKNGDGKRVCV